MDKNIQKELKEKLEKEKTDLEQGLKKFAKKNETLPGDWDTKFPQMNGSGLEEAADEVEEYSNLLSVEHGLELRLSDVNLALKKIEEKKYGKCDKCGKDIGADRLKFYPAAKMCQNCHSAI